MIANWQSSLTSIVIEFKVYFSWQLILMDPSFEKKQISKRNYLKKNMKVQSTLLGANKNYLFQIQLCL